MATKKPAKAPQQQQQAQSVNVTMTMRIEGDQLMLSAPLARLRKILAAEQAPAAQPKATAKKAPKKPAAQQRGGKTMTAGAGQPAT